MASKREVAAKLTPADLGLLARAAELGVAPIGTTVPELAPKEVKRVKALVKLIRSVPGAE